MSKFVCKKKNGLWHITYRRIDIFFNSDRFHETFVCINNFFIMHSNIYSCLFHDENIKEENIIDSNAARTNANVVTSLQIKTRKTHLLFVFDLKIYRKMRLCVIMKKKKKAYCDYWVACVQWMDLKTLNIISKHLYCY